MQQSVPEYMMDALAAVGVPVPELFYAVHTDMTPEGEYADVYVAISKDRLYILYGEERIVKVTGARRIVSDYRAEKLETIELSMFDDYKTEKLLSTGRFIGLIKENKTDCDEDRADEADKADEADEEVKNDPADAVKKAEKKDSFNESCLLLFSLGYMSYADRLIKAIKNIKDGNDPLKDIALDENLYCPKCGTRYPEPERK
ncbi:MAG: hypothetical protein FWE82_03060, partial [Defluviitaleaceae bacterium]|nr:hypothetical protein [Defluviitaleaceae bacterium]